MLNTIIISEHDHFKTFGNKTTYYPFIMYNR